MGGYLFLWGEPQELGKEGMEEKVSEEEEGKSRREGEGE
jgi:hypothetical protein